MLGNYTILGSAILHSRKLFSCNIEPRIVDILAPNLTDAFHASKFFTNIMPRHGHGDPKRGLLGFHISIECTR